VSNVELNQQLTGGKLSVAPMMDWTDRHCRYFHRLLTRRALLYTEPVHFEVSQNLVKRTL
jgi:tRNA-dihydrouridine synthase A